MQQSDVLKTALELLGRYAAFHDGGDAQDKGGDPKLLSDVKGFLATVSKGGRSRLEVKGVKVRDVKSIQEAGAILAEPGTAVRINRDSRPDHECG